MTILFALAAITAQVPPVPGGPTPIMYDYRPTTVECDGGSPRPLLLVRPIPSAGNIAAGQTVAPYHFAFRIDATGRPLGIVPATRVMTGVFSPADDLQPALAASRFVAGAAQAGCRIRYEVAAIPIAAAPLDLVHRYLALPHPTSYVDAQIQRRARDMPGDCFTGRRPAMLLRAYPDFDRIAQPSGGLSATTVGFDIDAGGKPVRIRTIASDGHAALDAAGIAAMRRSRFVRGARTGCVESYYRRQSTPLAPPEMPPIDGFRKVDGGCDEDRGAWALPPRMSFPEPFRRRAIEGWAIVRYDVAPWGQTGNVTVIASEPAAMFGEHARQIIIASKRPPSDRGASGCVDRVRFKLPATEAEDVPPATIPTPPVVVQAR